MVDRPRLKEKYSLARCCRPAVDQAIIGYYSHDDFIKVHRSDCSNLAKAESDRVIGLEWSEIIEREPFTPNAEYRTLDRIDFAVLEHHRRLGIDYSLMVAKVLHISKQDAFNRHKRLKETGLLERVPATMVRYREKTADHKWIKHRNHTYYCLTDKGNTWLDFRLSEEQS